MPTNTVLGRKTTLIKKCPGKTYTEWVGDKKVITVKGPFNNHLYTQRELNKNDNVCIRCGISRGEGH